jgi:Domain of unknown function (DUF6371)/CHC2 zinc finger
MNVSNELIQQVKEKATVLDVVSTVVNLKQKGTKYFGLCPFHNEHSPSFCVTPSKNMYYCFGCGCGGDAIHFIQHYYSLNFIETIERMAAHYNLIDFWSSDNGATPLPSPQVKSMIQKQGVYIDKSLIIKGLNHYDNNHLVTFMRTLFSDKQVQCLIKEFNIGTSKAYQGSNLFWYLDEHLNVTYGKIMLYDAKTGKRNKQYLPKSVHDIMKLEKPSHSLYGLHRIQTEPKNKVIAMVESEKTAILMTALMPQMIWVATGGMSQLNFDKYDCLFGRFILLYPDGNAFDLWSEKAKQAKSEGFNVQVDDYLKKGGYNDNTDILDIAIENHWFKHLPKIEPNEPKKEWFDWLQTIGTSNETPF